MEKLAKKIVEIIKKELNEKKKKGNYGTYSFCINYCSSLAGYSININYENITKTLDAFDFKRLIRELTNQLNNLKVKKEWQSLCWDKQEINISTNVWRNDYISLPNNFTIFSKPCKEYTSLSNYIEKYCGKKINVEDIYLVGIGGKRGRIYGEEGDRMYLAYNPKKCLSLLQELRDNRGSKDIVKTSLIKEVDEIDDWELECSIRNEVEFSGTRHRECGITIQTPKGKIKKEIKIRAI